MAIIRGTVSSIEFSLLRMNSPDGRTAVLSATLITLHADDLPVR